MFDNIDFEDLRAIGLTQEIANRLAQIAQQDSSPGTRPMRVTQTQRDWYTLHDGRAERPARALHRAQLSIGDWVLAREDEHGEWWIAHAAEPVTQIARRANDGRRQPLASNVDTALLVMGLDADYNPHRQKRNHTKKKTSKDKPKEEKTKTDSAADAQARCREVFRRLPATVPVSAVNAHSAQAVSDIAPWRDKGRTLVLL